MITTLLHADMDLPEGASLESPFPWGRMTFRKKKGWHHASRFEPFLWRQQKWVLVWQALCLSSDGDPEVWRRQWSPPLGSGCITAWGSWDGGNTEGLAIVRFQISASAKALIVMISSHLLTINSVTCQAGFLERFHGKWHGRTMRAFLHIAAHLGSRHLPEVSSLAALYLEKAQTFLWLPFV